MARLYKLSKKINVPEQRGCQNQMQQSVSGVATSCIKYCSTSPPHGLHKFSEFTVLEDFSKGLKEKLGVQHSIPILQTERVKRESAERGDHCAY